MQLESIEKKLGHFPDLVHKKFIAFGAGNCGKLAVEYLKQYHIQPAYFCDNDENKWGKMLEDGCEVRPPEILAQERADEIEIIITSGHCYHIARQLQERFGEDFCGFSTWIDYQKAWDKELIEREASKIGQVIQALEDEKSKQVYSGIIRKRTMEEYDYSDLSEGRQYFVKDLVHLGEEEVFADIGAYDGDTSIQFLREVNGKYKKIIAFEPDKNNYGRLCEAMRGYENVTLYQCGLADRKATVGFYMDPLGAMSEIIHGGGYLPN